MSDATAVAPAHGATSTAKSSAHHPGVSNAEPGVDLRAAASRTSTAQARAASITMPPHGTGARSEPTRSCLAQRRAERSRRSATLPSASMRSRARPNASVQARTSAAAMRALRTSAESAARPTRAARAPWSLQACRCCSALASAGPWKSGHGISHVSSPSQHQSRSHAMLRLPRLTARSVMRGGSARSQASATCVAPATSAVPIARLTSIVHEEVSTCACQVGRAFSRPSPGPTDSAEASPRGSSVDMAAGSAWGSGTRSAATRVRAEASPCVGFARARGAGGFGFETPSQKLAVR